MLKNIPNLNLNQLTIFQLNIKFFLKFELDSEL